VAINKLSNQNGLILGLSLVVGLVAAGKSFFPGVVPASLSPLLQNSVAMGGFTAFMLSTAAYLAPKRGIGGVFRADIAETSAVLKKIEMGREKLKLSTVQFNILCLCCEEAFVHMITGESVNSEHSLTLRISLTDEGCFTEMVCGHKMDDINNFAIPESLLKADTNELNQLGLLLFSQYARDVKHLEISGYSYISFLV
jgi:hypothetical protein